MQSRVLLLSQRRIAHLVAYCIGYEFEDVLASVTDATRIDSTHLPSLELSRRGYKLVRLATGSAELARKLAPPPRGKVSLTQDYELFFPIFSHTYELYSLATISDWRKRCRKAACFITEVWSDMLPPYLLELLAPFDHIFVGCQHSAEHVARMTGRPCTYLPLAADVLRFAPHRDEQARPIEVCNIGRRSSITHQALLEDSDRRQTFYYYDTVAASGTDQKHRTFQVDFPDQHRRMLATLLKHSRYFIANRSYVNRPEFTAGRDEISSRFYEGAAAGTVMIGEAPRTQVFKEQFDWPDAVIHVPFDSADIGRIVAGLNEDRHRMATIRRANAREAALRHDWLHRIQVVFDTLELERTEQMRVRAQKLDGIASHALVT